MSTLRETFTRGNGVALYCTPITEGMLITATGVEYNKHISIIILMLYGTRLPNDSVSFNAVQHYKIQTGRHGGDEDFHVVKKDGDFSLRRAQDKSQRRRQSLSGMENPRQWLFGPLIAQLSRTRTSSSCQVPAYQ